MVAWPGRTSDLNDQLERAVHQHLLRNGMALTASFQLCPLCRIGLEKAIELLRISIAPGASKRYLGGAK